MAAINASTWLTRTPSASNQPQASYTDYDQMLADRLVEAADAFAIEAV